MKQKLKIIYFTDPGHGWLKVKRSLLVLLKIDHTISEWSYQKNDMVYLEDDGDGNLLLVGLKHHNIPFTIVDKHTDKQSKIRTYDTYEYEINIRVSVSLLMERAKLLSPRDFTHKMAVRTLGKIYGCLHRPGNTVATHGYKFSIDDFIMEAIDLTEIYGENKNG